VASTLDYAAIMIKDYFGFNNFKINRQHNIGESGLEYVLYITVLAWKSHESYEAEVVVRYFTLNEV